MTEGVLLSVDEVAERFGVDDSTVRRMLYRNEFPGAFKVGRLWKIPEADVEAYPGKWRERQVATSAVES